MDRGGNISVDELKGWYSPLGFGKGGGLDKAGQVPVPIWVSIKYTVLQALKLCYYDVCKSGFLQALTKSGQVRKTVQYLFCPQYLCV